MVDALSLSRSYFDIYIGFSALSCERSVDQAPHLLYSLHLELFDHIFSGAVRINVLNYDGRQMLVFI